MNKKCYYYCGYFRDGKCYCQDEINFDETNIKFGLGDYLWDMVEEGNSDARKILNRI